MRFNFSTIYTNGNTTCYARKRIWRPSSDDKNETRRGGLKAEGNGFFRDSDSRDRENAKNARPHRSGSTGNRKKTAPPPLTQSTPEQYGFTFASATTDDEYEILKHSEKTSKYANAKSGVKKKGRAT